MNPRLIVVSALFSAISFVSATQTNTSKPLAKRANGVSWNPWDAAYQTFDYVVVGGGLTGITVAARLAENPSVSVLVVEAGQDNRWDERVKNIYTYGQAFGSELDWSWPIDHGRNIAG
jgi:choline dehydrogenase